MQLGVFGGTFDPPHVGHLILASEAVEQLRLDRLLWVLTPDPPHKQGQVISSLEARLKLVQAAIGDNPCFELSLIEVDRPGPHYALDTVRLLKQAFEDARIFYLIGGDSLRDLPGWHRPGDLIAEISTLGVVRRPGDQIDLSRLEQAVPGLSARIEFIDAPLMEISAREIRQRVAEGRHYRYYLPPAVYTIIEQMGLYRSI
ncbi:MAG: nicotinate-nucleotide adenylyltransferase [Chloroflexota bacterium]